MYSRSIFEVWEKREIDFSTFQTSGSVVFVVRTRTQFTSRLAAAKSHAAERCMASGKHRPTTFTTAATAVDWRTCRVPGTAVRKWERSAEEAAKQNGSTNRARTYVRTYASSRELVCGSNDEVHAIETSRTSCDCCSKVCWHFLNLPFETQTKSPLLQSTFNNEVVAISSTWKSEIRECRVAPVLIPGL